MRIVWAELNRTNHNWKSFSWAELSENCLSWTGQIRSFKKIIELSWAYSASSARSSQQICNSNSNPNPESSCRGQIFTCPKFFPFFDDFIESIKGEFSKFVVVIFNWHLLYAIPPLGPDQYFPKLNYPSFLPWYSKCLCILSIFVMTTEQCSESHKYLNLRPVIPTCSKNATYSRRRLLRQPFLEVQAVPKCFERLLRPPLFLRGFWSSTE